jgi:enolase
MRKEARSWTALRWSILEVMGQQFPIVSLEDGLAQDDWEGCEDDHEGNGDRVQIVGDDLLVTNPERIAKAIKEDACNSVLIM